MTVFNSTDQKSWVQQFKEGLKWLKDSKEFISVPKEIQKQRYRLCRECESFAPATKQCRECDCFMPLKTRMNISPCPKGYWKLL